MKAIQKERHISGNVTASNRRNHFFFFAITISKQYTLDLTSEIKNKKCHP